MMPLECEQRGEMSAGGTDDVAISFADKLRGSELLTGTPTVVEVDTSDLTLSNKAISTAILTILGESTAIAAAVQFRMLAGTSVRGTYEILVTATTDTGRVIPVTYYVDIR